MLTWLKIQNQVLQERFDRRYGDRARREKWAMKLSRLRGWLLVLFASTIVLESLRWLDPLQAAGLKLGLLLLAGLSDGADGWVARATNSVSNAGKRADPFWDKVFTSGAMVLLAAYDQMSIAMVAAFALRDVAVDIFRNKMQTKGVSLPAKPAGKIKTAGQFLWIGLSIIWTSQPSWLLAFGWVLVGLSWYAGVEIFLFGVAEQNKSLLGVKGRADQPFLNVSVAVGLTNSLVSLTRKLGLANRITSLRVPLAIMFATAWIIGWRWEALVFLTLAASTDLLDGLVARRRHEITELGKRADPWMDHIMAVIALVVLMGTGTIQRTMGGVSTWVVVSVYILEELFKLKLWSNGRQIIDTPKSGKVKAAVMAIVIVAAALADLTSWSFLNPFITAIAYVNVIAVGAWNLGQVFNAYVDLAEKEEE